MGIIKLLSCKDYWSKDSQLHNNSINDLMTANRVRFLLNYLHINDNS